MHIHLLGIGGTFMSGLALLATEAGFEVSGCDSQCYPPVSDLLRAKGVTWIEGYEVNEAFLKADLVVVGNAMKRGFPIVEALLNMKKPYISGPQWLYEQVLRHKRVLAISGTHGKTTTTCMVASILEAAGLKPGFLIGGVSPQFQTNARLGEGEWFVIEADEYDTAFFDKRPKFIHYHPDIAILNNLEYDHADIYADLGAIEQQFHYYLKTIPAHGVILKPKHDEALNRVLQKGCYSHLEDMHVERYGEQHPQEKEATWCAKLHDAQGSRFSIWHGRTLLGEVDWPLIGQFNVENALAAIAAVHHVGVDTQVAVKAISTYQPVKRRLELRANIRDISIYDDFAHHPTAIQKTLEALKSSGRHDRIVVALEFASFTMKTGVHASRMEQALSLADSILMLQTQGLDKITGLNHWKTPVIVCATTEQMISTLMQTAQAGDAILIMSNRGFDNLHERLILSLKS